MLRSYLPGVCQHIVTELFETNSLKLTHSKSSTNPSSQVKSSILFYQTASHLHIKIHIQNNVRRGMAKQRSIVYRAACHGTRYKIQATGISCRCNTENKTKKNIDNTKYHLATVVYNVFTNESS